MEFHGYLSLHSVVKYITVVLFIASTTARAELSPNYSNKEKKMVFFDSTDKDPLFLSCGSSAPGAIKWSKNGTDVSDVALLKGRYQIKENNLIIADTLLTDDGSYTCTHDSGESAEINVVAKAYLLTKKIPENMSVVEGEKLTIHCKAVGTNPKITWTTGDKEEINRTRINLQNDADNVKDAILIIDHAELGDRKHYNCTVTNEATGFEHKKGKYVPETAGTFVRVKGKYAALWPFLGIVAEVVILCAIILVYEKRRNKEGLDESDTDQSPEQEKLKTGK